MDIIEIIVEHLQEVLSSKYQYNRNHQDFLIVTINTTHLYITCKHTSVRVFWYEERPKVSWHIPKSPLYDSILDINHQDFFEQLDNIVIKRFAI